MPFTDAQLAAAMKSELVTAGVMTATERDQLLDDPTEVNVRDALSTAQLGKFNTYWTALDVWMGGQGGNLGATTGTNVPGRIGGNPTGVGNKAIYNDAFREVNQNIATTTFLPVKAVSNQLRFISVLG